MTQTLDIGSCISIRRASVHTSTRQTAWTHTSNFCRVFPPRSSSRATDGYSRSSGLPPGDTGLHLRSDHPSTRLAGDILMSASRYLAMKQRNPDDPPPKGWQQIPIRTPDRCDHTETVCTECWGIWSQDWKIRFRSTESGRDMILQLGLSQATVEMVLH